MFFIHIKFKIGKIKWQSRQLNIIMHSHTMKKKGKKKNSFYTEHSNVI